MIPKFQVQLKIRKPVAMVFDAVVRPEKLNSYFVQAASGPLVEGKTVKWRFAEVPGEHDVIVKQVIKDERIALEFPAALGSAASTKVEMLFKPLDAENTMVQISEEGWPADQTGVEAAAGNAGGWMHMMCCLKGLLEYGVNLRAGGAF